MPSMFLRLLELLYPLGLQKCLIHRRYLHIPFMSLVVLPYAQLFNPHSKTCLHKGPFFFHTALTLGIQFYSMNVYVQAQGLILSVTWTKGLLICVCLINWIPADRTFSDECFHKWQYFQRLWSGRQNCIPLGRNVLGTSRATREWQHNSAAPP